MDPAASGRPRPWTVTVAGVLLLGGAVTLLALVPALGWDLAHYDTALAEAARRTGGSAAEVSRVRSANALVDVLYIGAAVAGAAILAGAARWTRTGRYRAWMVAGVAAAAIGLCCVGVAGLGFVLGDDSPDPTAVFDQAQQIQSQAAPGWVNALEAVPLGTPVLCFGAVVLMWLPPSSRYIHPRPRTFDAGPDGIWVAQPTGPAE